MRFVVLNVWEQTEQFILILSSIYAIILLDFFSGYSFFLGEGGRTYIIILQIKINVSLILVGIEISQ